MVCAMDNYITLTIRLKLSKREMMTGMRIIRHNNGQTYPGAEWVVTYNHSTVRTVVVMTKD